MGKIRFMKSDKFSYIRYLAGIIIFSGALIYFVKNNGIDTISQVNVNDFIFLCFLWGLIYLNNTLRFVTVLQIFSIPLKPSTGFKVLIIGGFANLFLPFNAGILFKMKYLKQFYAIKSRYIVYAHLIEIVILLISSIVFLLGHVAFLDIFFSAVFMICFTDQRDRFLLFVKDMRADFSSAWHKTLIKHLALLFLYNIVYLLLRSFWLYQIGCALDLRITFGQAILFCIITAFSLLISITPGNLGIREFLFEILGRGFSLSSGTGLFISLFARCTSIIMLGVLTAYIVITEKTRTYSP